MRPLRLAMRAFGPFAGDQPIDFTRLGPAACFLIHGPTGAGKTSILDAICFALYGQSSGGERDARRLRSDHAEPTVATEVVFDFSLGATSYRVSRSPEQERPKARGTGTTTQAPKACLWRLSSAGPEAETELIASQPSRVTAEVERLLGFKSDQFTRVVMLPQGQFRKLLDADSRGREEILETLFQTEVYRRIEETLKDRARHARDELADVERQRQHYLDDASVGSEEDLEPLRGERVAECERIREELEGLRVGRKAAEGDLSQAREKAKLAVECAAAETHLAELEGQRIAMDAKASLVEHARLALPVAEADEAAKQRREESGAAHEARERCESALAAAATSNDEALAALRTEEARGEEREQATRDVVRLETLTGTVTALAAARDRAADSERLAQTKQAECGQYAEGVAGLEAEIEKVLAAHNEATILAGQRDARVRVVRSAGQALEQAAETQKARKKLAEARDRVEAAERTRQAAEKSVSEAESTRDKLEAEWVSGQAGLLARALVDEEPCPVCGSLDHPHPARSARRIPERQEVDDAQRVVKEAQDAMAAARAEEAAAGSQVNGLEQTIAALTRGSGAEGENVKALKKSLAAAKADAAAAEQAIEAASALGERLASLRREQAERREALKAAAAQLATLQGEAARDAARVTELESQLPETLREPGAVSLALASARQRVVELNAVLAAVRKKAETASRAHAAAVEALAAAARNVTDADARSRRAREEFVAKVAAAGFTCEEDYRAARLDQPAIDALAEEVRQFTTEIGAARDRAARAVKASPSQEVPDLAGLEARVGEFDGAIEETSRDQGQAVERLQRLAALIEALKFLAARRERAEADFRCIGQVSDVVNGQNAHGITLHRYVLGALLDEVLLAASQRLRVMSNGRFDLERQREREDGRRVGGLDLVVLDAYTGTERPANTLSGGEGFMASLSLALGLADVVQSYAAGIRLETVFVDEGFGSLDEEALDRAVETLMKLGDGGRLVGIISHVPELRTRISARLEVTATTRGSRATLTV